MLIRRVLFLLLFTHLFLNCMQAAEPTVKVDDLLVYYPLDDGTGNVARDESGNAHDGTLVGMDNSAWVDGKFGKALSFDGQADGKGNDRLQIPTDSNVEFHGFSISMWFKTGHNHTNAGMLYFGSPGGSNGFGTQQEFHINFAQSGNKMQFWGLNGLDQSTSATFNDDVWHHLVSVNEPGNFVLYIDGGTAAKLVDADSPGNFAFSRENQLGGSAVAERAYTGLIDDFRIYSTLLTETDALALYNNGNGDYGNPPVITLVGDPVIEIQKDAAFTDPGATATDQEDGDIAVDDIEVIYNTGGKPPELLTGVTAVEASSQYQTRTPEKSINGSGLNGGQHSNNSNDMWMTNNGDALGYITYDLGMQADLSSIHIWNHNQGGWTARGVREVELFVDPAADGNSFTSVGIFNVQQASGQADYSGEKIDLAGIFGAAALRGVRLVKFQIISNHGDGGFSGISEVQFTANESIASETLDTSVPGVYLATYTATDSGGLTDSVTREIRISDPDAPVITLTGGTEVSHEKGAEFTDPGYIVLDKDDNEIDTSNNPVLVSGAVDVHTEGEYTLRYEFKDDQGREALMVVRTVTVADTLPPEITLVGGDTIKHPLGQPFEDPGFFAVDLADGPVDVGSTLVHINRIRHRGFDHTNSTALLDFSNNGGMLDETPDGERLMDGPLNFTQDSHFQNAGVGIVGQDSFRNLFTGYFRAKVEGSYEFGVQGEDDSGSFWLDLDQDGVFSENGKLGNEWMNRGVDAGFDIVHLKSGIYRFAIGHSEGGGGSRIDARFTAPAGGGPTSRTIIQPRAANQQGLWFVLDELNVSVPGTHTITYTASDASGQTSTVTRTVEIIDFEKQPVITLQGRVILNHEQYTDFIDPGFTVADADGNPLDAALVQIVGEVDVQSPGIYSLSYSFFDAKGVPAETKIRTVTVRDTSAPVLVLAGDAEIEIMQGEVFTDPGATLVDEPEGGLVAYSTASGIPTNGLWGHFDASNLPGFQSGDRVYQWTDVSGKGNHLSDVRGDPQLVADGVNGMPAVHFDGSDFIAATREIQRQYSVYTVSRLDGAINRRLISSRNRNWILGYHGGSEDLFHPNSWVTHNDVPATQNPHLYAATSTGSNNVQFYADGENLTISPTSSNSPILHFQLGGYLTQSESSTGYVAEILLYENHVTSLEERLTIETLLGIKYGIMGYPKHPLPDFSQPGEHTVVYAARDKAGNVGTITRKVTVLPKEGVPVITLTGDSTMTMEVGEGYEEPGVVVKDSDDQELDANQVVVSGSLDTMIPGVHYIHYDFTTGEGVAAETVTRTVIIQDTQPPVITLNGEEVVRIQVGETYQDAGATAQDSLSGEVFVWSDISVPQEGLTFHINAESFSDTRDDGQNLNSPWEDLSPNKYHVDNRAGDPKWLATALNGKPVVDFDGNDYLWTTHNFTNDLKQYTIISVARYTGGDNERVITSINRDFRFGYDADRVRFFHAQGTVYNQSGSDTDWHLHVGDVNDRDQANFWFDGTQLANNHAGLPNYDYMPAQINLAAQNNGQRTSKCQIAELLVYNRVLTDSEREGLQAYLNTKYDLNGGGTYYHRFDHNTPGAYDITYYARDENGYLATAKRTVIVSPDTTKPFIELAGESNHTIEADPAGSYADPGAAALAADGTLLEADLTGQGTVDLATPGTYELVYTYTDAEPITRKVHVVDSTAPVLSLNGEDIMEVFVDTPFEDPGVVAMDALDGEVDVYSDYVSIPNRLTYRLYTHGHNATYFNINNNGGLFDRATRSKWLFTGGLYNQGINFDDDPDWQRFSGLGLGDGFQVMFDGRFEARIGGEYLFETTGATSDYHAVWIDKDQDGVFEHDGDQGDERIHFGVQLSRTILEPGIYRIAMLFSENNNTSTFRVRFSTPEGAGPFGLTSVNPSDPEQEGLWSTYPDTLDTSVLGSQRFSYFAEDEAGNVSRIYRTVIVLEPPAKPIIHLLGDADYQHKGGTAYQDPGFLLDDHEGNPLDASLVVVSGVPNGSKLGVYTVRYNFTDADGRVADTVSRIVRVVDLVPPEITLVGGDTLAHIHGEKFVEPGAFAWDAVDGNVGVVVEGAQFGTFAMLDIGPSGQRVETGWAEVSGPGNNSNGQALAATQVTSLSGETFQIAISNVDWRDRGNSTNSNNVAKIGEDFIKTNGGDFTITLSDLPEGNYKFTTYHLDPSNTQSHLIHIYVSDANGQDMLQGDSGNANLSSGINGITVDIFEQSSAIFNVTSNGVDDVVIRLDGQGPDTETPINGMIIENAEWTPDIGTFELTYTATDSNGNSSQVTRTIIVSDDTAIPSITLVGEDVITINAGGVFEDPGVILKDKDGNDLDASLVEVSGSVDVDTVGTYLLGYSYTDGDGKIALAQYRTVIIQDHLPPVITLVGGDTLIHQLGNPFVDPGYSATDNLDGPVWVHSSHLNVNRIRMAGYVIQEDYNTTFNLAGSGHLYDRTPNGETTIGRALDFGSDGAFRNALPAISQDDRFQTLFDGYFVTESGGRYEFGISREDDNAAFWFDSDGDGVFEQTGDNGRELMNNGYNLGFREVDLLPGKYRYVVMHRENTGGASVTAQYKAVSGDGPGTRTTINPASPLQDGHWITYNPIEVLAPGEHTITYTAEDKGGNVATAVRTVIVKNNPDAGIITLNGDAEITVAWNEVFTDPGATVQDIDGNDLPLDNLVVSGEVDTSRESTYTLNYSYTTPEGVPSRIVSRTVIVKDLEKPALTLLGDEELSVFQGSAYEDPGATSVDNKDGEFAFLGSSELFPEEGLVLHLDAGHLVGKEDGDPVTSWLDLSPVGNHANIVTGTPSYAVDAVNGLPGVYFDGASLLSVPRAVGTDYTILAVSRLGSLPGQRLLSSQNENFALGYHGNYLGRFVLGNGWAANKHVRATLDPQLYSATAGNFKVQFYDNGHNITNTPLRQDNNYRMGFFQMGGLRASEEISIGYVSEVIIYERVLTNSERIGIEARLNAKYGLNGVEKVTVPVDTSRLGEYSVVYQSVDRAGNIATKTRKVIVQPDPNAPTITLNGEQYITFEAAQSYTDAGAVLTDSDSNVLDDSLLTIKDNVDPHRPGVYTYTYHYEPETGAPALPVTRHVEVVDTMPPVVTLNGEPVVKLEIGATYIEDGATATDQGSGDVPALSSLEYTYGRLAHNGYMGNRGDGSLDLRDGGGLLGVDPAGSGFLTNGPGGRGLDFSNDTEFRDAGVGINDRDNFQNLFHGMFVAPLDGTYSFEMFHRDDAASIWIDLDQDGNFELPGDKGNERLRGPTSIGVAEVHLESGIYAFAVAHRETGSNSYVHVKFAENGAIPVNLVPADPAEEGHWVSVDSGQIDTSQAGTHTIEYTAYDVAGNHSSVFRTVVVVDDATVPFIALKGDSVYRHELGEVFVDPEAIVTDADDNELKADLEGVGNVDVNVLGQYTLTYDYTDPDTSKVAETVTRTVIVEDTTTPEVALVEHPTFGGTDTVELTVGEEWVDPGITLTDADSAAWYVSSREYIPNKLIMAGIHGNNTMIDFNNNGGLLGATSRGSTFFTTGPSGKGYNFESEADFKRIPIGITQNDYYASYLIGYFRAGIPGEFKFQTDADDRMSFYIDSDDDGVFFNTPERLIDGNGTRTITTNLEADYHRFIVGYYENNGSSRARFYLQAPEGAGPSDDLTIVKPADAAQAGLWYIDGDGPIETTFPGEHQITYYAFDTSGQQASITRTVIVKEDPDAPVLTLVGDEEILHQIGTDYDDELPTIAKANGDAIDDQANIVTSFTLDGNVVSEVNKDNAGTYVIQYDYTDGNSKSAIPVSRKVIVDDYIAPVITLLGDNPFYLSPGYEYLEPGATATDEVDGDLTVNLPSTNFSTAAEATILLEYRVTDAAGNLATATRELIIKDDPNRPVILLTDGDAITHEAGEPFVDPGFVVTNGRGHDLDETLVTVTGNVDHTILNTYTLTYNYDDNGSVASPILRSVEVVDTTSPTIDLTEGTHYRIQVGQTYVDPGATVTDNLDTSLTYTTELKLEGTVPVAHWDFNQTDGTVAQELMNSLDGTLQNFATPADSWVPGKYGNALKFDASSSNYVRIPGSDVLDLQQFTISMWVNSDNFNNGMFLFEKTTNNIINTQYNVYLENDANLYFKTFGTDSTQHSLAAPTGDFVNNEWQHIVVTFDGENKMVYLNEELAATETHQVTLTTSATGPSYIGAYAPGDGYFFNGLIDDLKIYDIPFAESQIPELAKQSGIDTSVVKKDPYEVTYRSTDSSGNTSEVIRYIVVSNDTTPPTISLIDLPELEVELNADFTDPGATANDNQDGDISAKIVYGGTVDTTKAGVYTLTYDVEDLSYNAATQVTRTVTVGNPTEPTDPLEQWVTEHLSTAPVEQQDPMADPDLDQITNFLEYALGGNPNNQDQADTLPELKHDTGSLQITFLRLKASVDPDITYTAELTTDLVNGTWSDANVTTTVNADQNGVPANYEKVTATANVAIDDEPDAQQFLRITVTRP